MRRHRLQLVLDGSGAQQQEVPLYQLSSCIQSLIAVHNSSLCSSEFDFPPHVFLFANQSEEVCEQFISRQTPAGNSKMAASSFILVEYRTHVISVHV